MSSQRGSYKGTEYESIISDLVGRKRSDNNPEKCPKCQNLVYTYDGLRKHIEVKHPSDVKHTPKTKRMRVEIQEQSSTTEEPVHVMNFENFDPDEISPSAPASLIEDSIVDSVKDLEFFQVIFWFIVFIV